MKIVKTSWIAKLYVFAKHCTHNFVSNKKFKPSTTQNTNICELINVSFIRMPIVVAAWIATMAFLVFAIIIYPIQELGVTTIGLGLGQLALLLFGVAVIVTGVVFIVTKVGRLFRKKVINSDNMKVISTYIKDQHDGICSLVDFVDQKEADTNG